VNTWKVIFATLVIFITGLVTGGLLVRYTERAEANHPEHGPAPAHPAGPGSAGGVRLDLLRRMQKELDLSPDQRQRIDKLLKESQERTKKLMEPIAPELHAEVQRTKNEFRAVLTPEQQPRFDELLRQAQRAKEPKKAQPPRDRSSLTNPTPTTGLTNSVGSTNMP
jgi:Spy/CpxP family protein refolding chaperone